MGKGRITGAQRKEKNARMVADAMSGDMEDIMYARVLKHLGAGHVRIILDNKREGIARIRSLLCKRGSTPIVTDDIVIISGREFETKSNTVGADGKLVEKTDKYDLLGVLTRQQAAKLEKEGKIPSWFVALGTDGSAGDEGDIFDYSEAPADNDEEVNVAES